jgi:hypothetical protein
MGHPAEWLQIREAFERLGIIAKSLIKPPIHLWAALKDQGELLNESFWVCFQQARNTPSCSFRQRVPA